MEQVQYYTAIARNLALRVEQVTAAAKLLAEGATIAFVARYRKEATGLLDETQLTLIRDQHAAMVELDKRRSSILESLAEREMLTAELKAALRRAPTLATLEDLYLPHRPKRRTRSMIAKERGLEPLALAIFAQDNRTVDAHSFVNGEKEVASVEEALAGARDIIAEWINEDALSRAQLRKLFAEKSLIHATVIKKNQDQGAKFRDYFDWHEPVIKAAGHRLLAMFRGEKEKFLTLSCRPPEDAALALLKQLQVKRAATSPQVVLAVEDCYKRLLAPSLENELRSSLKDRADQEAIAVFATNLRQLLLAPALGRKRVLALDPGFRTGAKLVCLDSQGKLIDYTTIYPTHSETKAAEAGKVVVELCRKHHIEAIAIGNGTASRETEGFVRALGLGTNVIITMVDESGASIYSASDIARAEFPDHDVTVRGAVSIGRRLQDPLAELVKLDPKSIGVGQYQHDVSQAELKKSLDDVVISCVNSVGVEVNTASMELLTRVSGLGPALAKNIIAYRNEHGAFSTRTELRNVARLGAKAFEQCAGFLRIREAHNPLDSSGVHPERYALVERMARDAGCRVADLLHSEELRRRIVLTNYVDADLGMPTLRDIMAELEKPGRDPRAAFSLFAFAAGVTELADLTPGMKLPGIVTNITKFGVFVDIGVHQDGLIHVSQLADRFVKDPSEVVKVRQEVRVRVLEVDRERKRISLSLRNL